mmetsp:Transcript_26046/g.49470  ORF Transcript_26046/g.49470 Transcript_26046/m.49470 type:complete len:386 (+) Transcript_26046:294-1451(+)
MDETSKNQARGAAAHNKRRFELAHFAASDDEKRCKRMFKSCEYDGCTKFARGNTKRCVAHGGGRRCLFERCNRAARGKEGTCIAHGGGKRCTHTGCSKSAVGRSNLCIAHGGGRFQGQSEISGSILTTDFPLAGSLDIQCQFEGCCRLVAQGNINFCTTHEHVEVCKFIFCSKIPKFYGYCEVHWAGNQSKGAQSSFGTVHGSSNNNNINISSGEHFCEIVADKRNVSHNFGPVWRGLNDDINHDMYSTGSGRCTISYCDPANNTLALMSGKIADTVTGNEPVGNGWLRAIVPQVNDNGILEAVLQKQQLSVLSMSNMAPSGDEVNAFEAGEFAAGCHESGHRVHEMANDLYEDIFKRSSLMDSQVQCSLEECSVPEFQRDLLGV